MPKTISYKPGQVLKRFDVGGTTVLFRCPKISDVQGLSKYYNSLVRERNIVGADKPISKADVTKHLRMCIAAMKSNSAVPILVEIDGNVAGEATLDIETSRSPSVHVARVGLAVMKAYRGMGIGTKILTFFFDCARKLGIKMIRIDCASDNETALSLYRKVGFKLVGKIPRGFQRSGKFVDESILIKEL